MKQSKLFYLLIGAIFLFAKNSYSQEIEVPTYHIPIVIDYSQEDAYDTIPKETARIFDSSVAEKYDQLSQKYQSGEFVYDEARRQTSTFWERVSNWLRDFFRSFAPDWNFEFLKLFYYLLLFLGCIAIVYVIYRLVSGRTILKKSDEKIQEDEIRFVEKNLMSIDIEAYIQQAIQQQQWNLAIRYLHLKNLQLLAQKGIIEWDYRKTNQAILNEIQSESIQKAFQRNTQLFNYIWFGNFELTPTTFEEFRQDFMNFKKELS